MQRPLVIAAAVAAAFAAGAGVAVAGVSATAQAPALAARADTSAAARPSSIVAEREAKRDEFDWGALVTYHEGESHSVRDELVAVAIIDPGQEIHPPHDHAEEEYLMVLEGEGTWSLNGVESPARAGDLQYAAPWDLHGIRNTGTTPLRFVVWKWNGKGVPPLAKPR